MRQRTFSTRQVSVFAGRWCLHSRSDLFPISGPGPRLATYPINPIDFIDNNLYRHCMGHLQPLVTRRYADYGMQRSAICHQSRIVRS
jgi:hypothetical protein